MTALILCMLVAYVCKILADVKPTKHLLATVVLPTDPEWLREYYELLDKIITANVCGKGSYEDRWILLKLLAPHIPINVYSTNNKNIIINTSGNVGHPILKIYETDEPDDFKLDTPVRFL